MTSTENSLRVSTIRGLIDLKAEEFQDKTFLICPDTGDSLTYAELRSLCMSIAATLNSHGARQGDKIAYLSDNGLFASLMFLGNMYGGYVSVPLNLTLSEAELAQILKHCEASAVFASSNYFSTLESAVQLGDLRPAIYAVKSDDDLGLFVGNIGPKVSGSVKPRDVALLAYTSGSTGRPKGVIMSHQNILAGSANTVGAHQLDNNDCSLCVLPLYHMNAQVVTLLATLASGGCVVMPRRFNASSFWDLVIEFRCTWFALVPSMISQLTHGTRSSCENNRTKLNHVRFARSSSAPLAPALHREFESQFDLPLIEAMGSTEGGGAIFSNPLPPAIRKIGSPGVLWGFEGRIVDLHGNDLPIGRAGELLLRGASVTQGYYNNPDLTAALKTPEGWLRTQDLACKDEDGYFFIKGRIKELIIKGGENIAPRLIDEALAGHPTVLEAAAVGVPDEVLGEDIEAFVIVRSDANVDEKLLRAHCRNEIGVFKTPTRIHFVDSLPRGPSGKVLRSKLAERISDKSSRGDDIHTTVSSSMHEFSRFELERRLTEIWSRHLRVEKIVNNENFFDLGGDSLCASQVFSDIQDLINLRLPISTLFEHDTISKLTLHILTKEKSTKDWSPVVALKNDGALPPFFGFYALDEVWFYGELARLLAPQQPFHGMLSTSLKPDGSSSSGIEELASFYISQIKRIQPQGPYLVGGQCVGAKIALEVALQLEDRGDTVALLVIFDSSAPFPRMRSDGTAKKSLFHYAERAVFYMRQGQLGGLVYNSARNNVRTKITKLKRRFFVMRTRSKSKTSIELNSARMRALNRMIASDYQARCYGGKITLIRSEQFSQNPNKDIGAQRWQQLTSIGLDIRIVPGGHISMFHEPYVVTLTRELQECIDSACQNMPAVSNAA